MLDVYAVNENLTLLDVVVPADEGQNGALSRAGGAHQGYGLLGLHMEGDSFQHPLVWDVGKPHVLKLDLAADLVQLNGVRLVHHLGLHVKDREDLLRRGHGGLEHVELLGEVLDGAEEPGGIHIEGDHGAAANDLAHKGGPPDIAPGRKVKETHDSKGVKQVDERPKGTEHEELFGPGRGQGGALLQKFLVFPSLLVEDLGDLHTGQVLRQIGVDVGGAVLHLTVGPAAHFSEHEGEEHQKGHKTEDHQGEGIIEHQHGAQDAHHREGVLHHIHQDVGKEHGDSVGVVGLSRHQLAHGNVVELLVGEAFDVDKQVLTQLGEDLLSGALEDDGLEIDTGHGYHQQPGVDRHHGIKLGQLKLLLHQVGHAPQDSGRNEVIGNGEDHDDQHQQEVLPIRLGVDQQPAEDLAVRHVPIKAHLLLFVFDAQVDDKESDGEDPHYAAHHQQR